MLVGFTQTAGTFNVLGVFMSPITAEFNWNRTTFAGAIGIGSLLGGVISPLIGPLVDRYGPRWALVIAFAIMGLTFGLMAWMTSLWHFYTLQVIGRMLNIGVVAVATSVIIPKWFIERRGRAVSTGHDWRLAGFHLHSAVRAGPGRSLELAGGRCGGGRDPVGRFHDASGSLPAAAT